jgi:hypothetical protein
MILDTFLTQFESSTNNLQELCFRKHAHTNNEGVISQKT